VSRSGGSYGAGHGPGERRNYPPRRSYDNNRGFGEGRSIAERNGTERGPRATKLTDDDVDAMFATIGRVRLVAFDFETTGLSAATDRIVEIGAAAFRMEEREGAWTAIDDGFYETLINPRRPIPAVVSAIHGIDDLAVSAAPTFAQAAPEFLAFIQGSILIAHNAPFDLGFLQAETKRAGLENPPNPAYDTISVAKTAVSGLPSYSLKALAASFSIAQTAAHRGGDDARVCMELFIRCINLINTSR
jgi:DNA polymerase III epsilon subunit family exonuclease